MEHSRGVVDVLRDLAHLDPCDGSLVAVIHDRRLSRSGAHLVVVETESCVRRIIVDQIVIGYSDKTDPVLDKSSELILRKLGNDTGTKSQKGNAGSNVEFCSAGTFFKNIAIDDAGMTRRGETQHNLAKCDQIERILIHIISSGFYMFCEIFSILYSQYNPRNGIRQRIFSVFCL